MMVAYMWLIAGDFLEEPGTSTLERILEDMANWFWCPVSSSSRHTAGPSETQSIFIFISELPVLLVFGRDLDPECDS